MDADGLPLVGPGINLAEVDPIAPKRMLAFLNHFIIHTVGFLNRFSVVCEEKLENLSLRIQRLETAVTILETKLQSIPGLDNITVASLGVQPAASSNIPTTATPVMNGHQQHPTNGPPPSSTPTVTTSAAADEPDTNTSATDVESKPDVSSKKACNDPRYSKYFRLLGMQIPKEALQQRMAIEGLDPKVLDNPDAVLDDAASGSAPPPVDSAQNRPPQKQDDSDHDFSDDEDTDQLSTSSSHASSSDFS